mmetsp:Transcript_17632/g.60963  ORF Transcript_17632/g.60963 Transcript_17632/m.60963 type:complete len:202 (-) Transcript_17632:82-687(-)
MCGPPSCSRSCAARSCAGACAGADGTLTSASVPSAAAPLARPCASRAERSCATVPYGTSELPGWSEAAASGGAGALRLKPINPLSRQQITLCPAAPAAVARSCAVPPVDAPALSLSKACVASAAPRCEYWRDLPHVHFFFSWKRSCFKHDITSASASSWFGRTCLSGNRCCLRTKAWKPEPGRIWHSCEPCTRLRAPDAAD